MMRTLLRRLPHGTRFGLVLIFLLLSIPAITGTAAFYIAGIRNDLTNVANREVPLADHVLQVAIGGLGQSVLFERVMRFGIEASHEGHPGAAEAYEAQKKAYLAIGGEITKVIEKAETQAKAILVDDTNDQRRAESMMMHEMLMEMKQDFAAFQITANRVFELLDRGDTDEALKLAAAGSARNLKLRGQIERLLHEVEAFASEAVVMASDREKQALRMMGGLLLAVFVIGSIGGLYSLRTLGYDLLRRELRERHLHERASMDKLTDLPNRAHFRSLAEKALQASHRTGGRSAVLFVDLDGFKAVNDTHGHDVGDLVLQEIAERLKRCVRESDTVGRLGGDEFAVCLASVEAADDARLAARRITDYMSLPYYANGKEIKLGASVGIALYPNDAEDIDTLLRRADQAMYAVKEAGGRSALLFSELVAATVHNGDVIQFTQSR